jgi:hypothetical protein
LRIFLDAKYPGIITHAAEAIRATRERQSGTVTRGNCVEVYSFSNHSADIHAIFRAACDRLEVRWTDAKPHTTYVSRKADVARLDDFVGPKR